MEISGRKAGEKNGGFVKTSAFLHHTAYIHSKCLDKNKLIVYLYPQLGCQTCVGTFMDQNVCCSNPAVLHCAVISAAPRHPEKGICIPPFNEKKMIY